MEVNTQGGCYGSALQAAAVAGHDTIVRLLLKHGADVNAQGGYCGNALQAAVESDHEAILLIEKCANIKGGVYGGALWAAVAHGRDATRSPTSEPGINKVDVDVLLSRPARACLTP